MSPFDPEVPPPGEEIHLPGGSIQPVLLTLGLTVGLVGVTTSVFLVIARHDSTGARPHRRSGCSP